MGVLGIDRDRLDPRPRNEPIEIPESFSTETDSMIMDTSTNEAADIARRAGHRPRI